MPSSYSVLGGVDAAAVDEDEPAAAGEAGDNGDAERERSKDAFDMQLLDESMSMASTMVDSRLTVRVMPPATPPLADASGPGKTLFKSVLSCDNRLLPKL